VINAVIRQSRGIDVHVISTSGSRGDLRARPAGLALGPAHSAYRVLAGLSVAAVAFGVLIPLVAHNSAVRPHHPGSITSAAGLLIYVGVVVVVAAIGGVVPACAAAVVAAAAVDWYLIPPYGSFAIARGGDTGYLAAFLATAVVVSIVVEQGARRRVEVLRSRDEAETVRALAGRLIQPNPLQAVLEEVHAVGGRESVTLLAPAGGGWLAEVAVGASAAVRPEDGEGFPLRDGRVLVARGRPLHHEEHRLITALMSYLEAVIAADRLRAQAALAERLSETSDLRKALLEAVSHDLRTPLASIRALTSGWLAPDVRLSDADTFESIAAIDREAQRLASLVDNLLDMSRLQAGALHLTCRRVGLDEVVPAAVASLSQDCQYVDISVPETLPRVVVDPALLERVVANLVDNAVRHSPPGCPVRVEAGAVAGRVDVRVADCGPGVPLAQREQMFEAFQQLGDRTAGDGVGLGLAVAKGFVDALGGVLSVEDTPGGGLTMVVSLPIASGAAIPEEHPGAREPVVLG
jgi:two-component system sensor histidine kinase KdpD